MIYCDNCGLANRGGSRFCNECGHRLGEWASCSSCGYQNPVNARFCSSCGERISIRRPETLGNSVGPSEAGTGTQQAGKPELLWPAAGHEAKTPADEPLLREESSDPTHEPSQTLDEEDLPLEVEVIGVSELLDIGGRLALPGAPSEPAMAAPEAAVEVAARSEHVKTETDLSSLPQIADRIAEAHPPTIETAGASLSPSCAAQKAETPSSINERTLNTAPAIAMARSGGAALAPVPVPVVPSGPGGEATALMSRIATNLQPRVLGKTDVDKQAGRSRLYGVLIGLLVVLVVVLAAAAALQMGQVELPR